MVFFPSSTQSRISATPGFYGEARNRLFLRPPGALRPQRSRRLDQLLNGGLILAARLQQVDADGAADGDDQVRRIGVELFQSGDELEAGDFAGAGAGALFLRGEAGAGAVGA